MLIPIRTDNRLSIRPTVNYAIVAINVAVFLIRFLRPQDYDVLSAAYMLDPAAPEVYQFFTSMFMHADFSHILGNMVFLWVFGNAVNDRFGNIAYAAFYLAGGVLSGLGFVLLSGHAPMLGASGAIAGVTGCYLVLFPRVRVTLVAWLLYFIVPIEVSSLVFLGFQFLFNIWASVGARGGGGGVAYVAHAVGYVYGIGIAAALLAVRLLPRDVYDMLSLWNSYRRRSSYRRMVRQGHDPFDPSKSVRPAESRRRRGAGAANVAEDDDAVEIRRRIGVAHADGDFPTASDAYLQLVALTDDAVLPQQQQLDVSNQLMSTQRYSQAADAYERLLQHYSGYEHAGDIRLMLGIIYGRYLQQRDRAAQNLRLAIDGLHDTKTKAMAQAELDALGNA